MPSFITFGQRKKFFNRNSFWVMDLPYMGGGWWAWPILIKLSTLLIIIIDVAYAKFHNFWPEKKSFLTEIHFGLYGRWAVGAADFDKSFHTSYYHNRDDLFVIRLSVSKQKFVDQNSFWVI